MHERMRTQESTRAQTHRHADSQSAPITRRTQVRACAVSREAEVGPGMESSALPPDPHPRPLAGGTYLRSGP